jgi:transposase
MPGVQALLVSQWKNRGVEGLSMVTVTNTTVTREHVWTAFRRPHEVRVREHTLLLRLDGKSCPEVAQGFSRDEETMRPRVHAFHAAGLQGWEREPLPGRPASLTAEPRAQVKEAVRRGPRESGSHLRGWTTKLVRHFLSPRLGIESGRERVRHVLHARGFRWRRLRHRHLNAKVEEQAAVRAELGALVAEWPEAWAWLGVDGATVRQQPTLTAPWGPVDEGPDVPTGDDPTTGQVDGAVAPLTGRTHDPVSHEWGQGDLAPFWQHLLGYYPRQRLLVIHERGEPPQGAPVEAVIREAGGQLMLKPQPAYSPALNPPERMWTGRRRVVTPHHWCATLHAHIDASRHFFRDLAGGKEQVQR